MNSVSLQELQKLLAFSQETGESLVVGLEDGPVVVVPFEKYQQLVLRRTAAKPAPAQRPREEYAPEPEPRPRSAARRLASEEYLVEPLE